MNLQELRDKIVAALKADIPLQGLIGSAPMRLYYYRPPQQTPTLPCVTYFVVNETPNAAMDTYGDSAVELQIDVWTNLGPDSAEAISEAITRVLFDDPDSLSSANYRVRHVRRTGGGVVFTDIMQDGLQVIQIAQLWTIHINDRAY